MKRIFFLALVASLIGFAAARSPAAETNVVKDVAYARAGGVVSADSNTIIETVESDIDSIAPYDQRSEVHQKG